MIKTAVRLGLTECADATGKNVAVLPSVENLRMQAEPRAAIPNEPLASDEMLQSSSNAEITESTAYTDCSQSRKRVNIVPS